MSFNKFNKGNRLFTLIPPNPSKTPKRLIVNVIRYFITLLMQYYSNKTFMLR